MRIVRIIALTAFLVAFCPFLVLMCLAGLMVDCLCSDDDVCRGDT